MKRLTISLVIALALAACGGATAVSDGPATDSSGEPTTTTATVAATTDSSGATSAATTAATTTATEASTTTAAPDPFLVAALAAAGTYEGTWTNTTFGSSGDASMTMAVSDSGDVTMEWDLGGFVFGAGDPDGENRVLNVSQLAGGVRIMTDLFGEIEIAVGDDFATLTIGAEDVPAAGIQAFQATATWMDNGTISGDYVVEFEGSGEPAVGEFTMASA